jgi:hypothetical protein
VVRAADGRVGPHRRARIDRSIDRSVSSPGDRTQPGRSYAGPRLRSLSVIQSVKYKWFTLIGPPLPRGPLPPPPLGSHRAVLLQPACPGPPPSICPCRALPFASFSHPGGTGRAVRFLLVTRGHRGLARPFVAPMSATSRPRSDTRLARVRACVCVC